MTTHIPPISTPSSPRWSATELNEARTLGDHEVDKLAEGIINDVPFDHATGRLGYQQLLGVADLLLLAPELVLLKDSSTSLALQRMPEKYVDYFDPIQVPAWVDEAKLARASDIWDENMLAIIGVLYASSLPHCYLMGDGISALYQTGKLGQHRFIYQRIYETGIMLDAVMHPRGLSIFQDFPTATEKEGKRYVWGRGYVVARKVRMLHASMRVLLTKPHILMGAMAKGPLTAFAASSIGALIVPTAGGNETQKPPLVTYDTQKLGQPVNQEDLAYTLLTFGLSIPEGLKRWGCKLSDYDCECFLHAWVLVGHIIGIEDRYLPDDYASAKELFITIKKRQAKSTDMGKKLTRSLQFFLAEYLPKSMRDDVPFMLIETLMPPDEAQMIKPHGTPPPSLRNRIVLKTCFLAVRWYFAFKALIVKRIPVAGKVLGSSFSIAGDALIDSWRDGFDRRPFYIPETANGGWRKEPGMNQSVRRALRTWRSQLFTTVFKGLALIIGTTIFSVLIALSATIYGIWHIDEGLGIILIGAGAAALTCGGGWIIGTTILTNSVKKVVARRPGPKEPDIEVPT